MDIKMKPIAEVTAQAMELLNKEMGIVDTARFIRQFSPGHGNYTEERNALLAGLTHDQIVGEIKNKRRTTGKAK